MDDFIFTMHELSEMESLEIKGGAERNPDGTMAQSGCSNSAAGCGAGVDQTSCSNSAAGCGSQIGCTVPAQGSCNKID